MGLASKGGLEGDGGAGGLSGADLSVNKITTTNTSGTVADFSATTATSAIQLQNSAGINFSLADNDAYLLRSASNTLRVGNGTASAFRAGSFTAGTASGNDAFFASTNGARWHVGTGASDYFSSNGTTISFAGPISVTGTGSATTFAANQFSFGGQATVADGATFGGSTGTTGCRGAATNNSTAIACGSGNFPALTTAGAAVHAFYSDSFTTKVAHVDKDGAIRLNIQGGGSQPAASAALRGTIWYTAGGAGVADKLEICAKSAGDTYSWVPVATPIT